MIREEAAHVDPHRDRSSESHGSTDDSRRDPAWWAGAVVLAILAVALATLLGNHRRDDPDFDVLDEGAHYGYVAALRDGRIPAWGDRLDQSTLRMSDCTLTAHADCGLRQRDPKAFPAAGYSYEAQQPPLGYLPFALTARPSADAATAIRSARRGGELWSVATAVLLLALGAVEGLPLLAMAVMLASCLLSPVYIHAAATVNNDAAGVAAGALALLVVAISRRWRRPMLGVGLAAGFLIGMLKGLFVLAPFALVVAAILTERPWSVPRKAWWGIVRRNLCVLGMLAAGTVAYVAWIEMQNLRAKASPSVVLAALLGFSHVDRFGLDTVVHGALSQLSILSSYYPDTFAHSIWNMAFFAAVIGAMIVKTGTDVSVDTKTLAAGTLIGMLAIAIAWPALSFIQGHYDQHAPARYSLPLLPLAALVAVRSVRRSGLVALGAVLPGMAVAWQLIRGF